MKREPERYRGLRRIRPWFLWKRCQKCGKEFRREYGWTLDPFYTLIVCAECCPTLDEAGYFLT